MIRRERFRFTTLTTRHALSRIEQRRITRSDIVTEGIGKVRSAMWPGPLVNEVPRIISALVSNARPNQCRRSNHDHDSFDSSDRPRRAVCSSTYRADAGDANDDEDE